MLAVANFHYIRKDFSAEYPSIFGLTPAEFENQLIQLAKHGQFISQSELLDKEFNPEDRLLLITFDDGLKEQFELAKPILDKMGIPFICFINSANFKEKKLSMVHKLHILRSKIAPKDLENEVQKVSARLTKEEVNKAIIHYNYDSIENARLKYLLNFKLNFAELSDCINPLFTQHFNEKIEVENLYMTPAQLNTLFKQDNLASHAHEHLPLAMLNTEEINSDLSKSQHFFQDTFGEQARILSYPYGSFEACTQLSVPLKSSGFKYAFTMERAINKNLNHPYLLARYDCNDLPGGKADLFKGKNIFDNPVFSKWYEYENSSVNR